jgi:aspartyl protease family protein
MIQADPNDRPLESEKRSSKFIYALTAIGIATIAAGIFYYWNTTSSYERVYSSLGIPPLPASVLIGSGLQEKVDRLAREPCYQDVAFDLAKAIREKGYPRESAALLISFAKRCPNTDYLLASSFNALMSVGDYKLAKQTAERLVQSYPARSLYKYYLALAQDSLKEYSDALTSYLDSIQMEPEPKRLLGEVFYKTSRMYAELGRYCDAITPIEIYISFDPLNRRNPKTQKIISDYARKGNCAVGFAQGSARIPANSGGTITLPVTINGVTGHFILDTGASLVGMTSSFASKANIRIEPGRRLTGEMANGGLISTRVGYADLIEVSGVQAKGVVVGVFDEKRISANEQIDGLLGMSFLARFNVKVSPGYLELSPIDIGGVAASTSVAAPTSIAAPQEHERPWLGVWAKSQQDCSNQDGLSIELAENTFDFSAFETTCKVRNVKQTSGSEFVFSLDCEGEGWRRPVTLTAQVTNDRLRFTKQTGLYFQPNIFQRCNVREGASTEPITTKEKCPDFLKVRAFLSMAQLQCKFRFYNDELLLNAEKKCFQLLNLSVEQLEVTYLEQARRFNILERTKGHKEVCEGILKDFPDVVQK